MKHTVASAQGGPGLRHRVDSLVPEKGEGHDGGHDAQRKSPREREPGRLAPLLLRRPVGLTYGFIEEALQQIVRPSALARVL
ncbi:MAG: hypothetical protein ACR2J6_06685 [Thermoleophilaceae bacterium]